MPLCHIVNLRKRELKDIGQGARYSLNRVPESQEERIERRQARAQGFERRPRRNLRKRELKAPSLFFTTPEARGSESQEERIESHRLPALRRDTLGGESQEERIESQEV